MSPPPQAVGLAISSSDSKRSMILVLARVFLTCAFVGVGFSIWEWPDSGVGSDYDQVLTVPDLDLSTIVSTPADSRLPEKIHAISVSVINNSPKPIAIVGIDSGCYGNACCRFSFDGKIIVEPHSPAVIRGELKCHEGPFDLPLKIYYDSDGLQTLTFHIRGIGANVPKPTAVRALHTHVASNQWCSTSAQVAWAR